MERLYRLPTLILILITSPILVSSQLQIPLGIGETDEQLDSDIHEFFEIINGINSFLGFYSFITYTGNIDLRPSLEQRLLEHFAMPIYTIGSQNKPLNHRYTKAANWVITLFSGLDDPTLAALNDTELSNGSHFYNFFYFPRTNKKRQLTMDEMWEFFSWCWQLKFDRAVLFFRGESELEMWTYFFFKNVTVTRIKEVKTFTKFVRSQSYRFNVQAANDLPSIFWYNSTKQADVIGGGNISLSGPVGIMMVEFMRYINATMDILPIQAPQTWKYDIFETPGDQRVDMVANLVVNDSLLFSPVVSDTQICLLVPHRRELSLSRYFDKVVNRDMNFLMIPAIILVFVIKYFAHRRRSLLDSLFNTIRFYFGFPLPAGQLDRLPMADKIIEVYALMFMAIFISACGSLLSSLLTSGIYYPPITDVASMRASGLRIVTEDPTIQQAFRDNRMPSALTDLVDLVDNHTVYKSIKNLNESVVNVARTSNWQGLWLYQEHLRNKRLVFAGPKLCSSSRYLRLPISPYSLLRFTFNEYFYMIFESGLHQKWLRMGYQKFREVFDKDALPTDTENDWKPLNIYFYTRCIKLYIGGMLLSTLVFIIELLYKRYHG